MSKSKKQNEDLFKPDDTIQALLIADEFDDLFIPFTDTTPMGLISLVNVPILEYALQSLAECGVNETFIFTCTHVDQIRDYIRLKQERYARWSLTMNVKVIASGGCHSLGDALRDIDAKGFLRDHFILLNATTVTNVDLVQALKNHKKTSKTDKNTTMTLLLSELDENHPHRVNRDQLILMSNAQTNRIIYYQRVKDCKKIVAPLDNFLDTAQVEIRSNLVDASLAICSPAALALFSDNFDFQTIDDLIKGLMNDEILMNSVYWQRADGFAANVNNWYMYHQVSQAVIKRWTFPLTPEMRVSGLKQSYTFLRNHIYRSNSVKFAKKCQVDMNTVLNDCTSVGENTRITDCVVGANCKIGRNVRLSHSYIMDNTVIGDECVVEYSVVGPNCSLGNNVRLEKNCILGEGVALNKPLCLNGVVVQAKKYKGVKTDDILGENAYKVEVDEDEDSQSLNRLYLEAIVDNYSSCSDTASSSDLSDAASIPDDAKIFYNEVIDSLARGYDDRLKCENLILEINSSRYAYNVTLQEVNYLVVKALLHLPQHISEAHDDYCACLFKILKYFLAILSNYLKNADSMTDGLQAIEDSTASIENFVKYAPKVLRFLLDQKIISAAVIAEWYEDLDECTELRKALKPFIAKLIV